ncbi:MAG: branched-chain amino acid ABC transporter permease [Chloroflexi bacterium]|nr:MAG: branched-chain amino acid ABC transporter permease [Chloroflexota bacterium]
MTGFWERNRAAITALVVTALVIGFFIRDLEPKVWVSILLSGLTLGALFFLVAAGLSLIFGLMDVLNFAHGIFFMLGAYIGWTVFTNPRLLFNTVPLFLALGAGMLAAPVAGPPIWRRQRRPFVQRALPWLLLIAGGTVAALAFRDYNLDRLVAFGPTVAGGSIPTAEAQEPISRVLQRMALMLVAGLILSPILARRHQDDERSSRIARRLGLIFGFGIVGLILLYARDAGETFVLNLNVDLRFLLALIVGTGAGALVGGLTEWALIRPLYTRPIYQVLLTLGLVFVGTEFVKAVWGPAAYPPLERPSFFSASCRSEGLLAWLSEHCASVNVLGRAFPTYRLFIIGVGLLVFVAVTILLRRSRLGMTIRAGVEDSEMVESLGINVRRMFTLVFALGSGLAALGGVVVTPFLGLNPGMGLEFLLQAFIVVVIGGLGSFPGAAMGAVLVGLARAFGDYFVISGLQLPGMAEQMRFSPAIARASTVLIMAIVLLVRPAGIFGTKE